MASLCRLRDDMACDARRSIPWLKNRLIKYIEHHVVLAICSGTQTTLFITTYKTSARCRHGTKSNSRSAARSCSETIPLDMNQAVLCGEGSKHVESSVVFARVS